MKITLSNFTLFRFTYISFHNTQNGQIRTASYQITGLVWLLIGAFRVYLFYGLSILVLCILIDVHLKEEQFEAAMTLI